MRMFVGVPWRGGLKRQGVVSGGNFGRHIFGAVRVEVSVIMQRHEVPHRLSSDFKMLDLK